MHRVHGRSQLSPNQIATWQPGKNCNFNKANQHNDKHKITHGTEDWTLQKPLSPTQLNILAAAEVLRFR